MRGTLIITCVLDKLTHIAGGAFIGAGNAASTVILVNAFMLEWIGNRAFAWFKGAITISGRFPALKGIGSEAFDAMSNPASTIGIACSFAGEPLTIHSTAFDGYKGSRDASWEQAPCTTPTTTTATGTTTTIFNPGNSTINNNVKENTYEDRTNKLCKTPDDPEECSDLVLDDCSTIKFRLNVSGYCPILCKRCALNSGNDGTMNAPKDSLDSRGERNGYVGIVLGIVIVLLLVVLVGFVWQKQKTHQDLATMRNTQEPYAAHSSEGVQETGVDAEAASLQRSHDRNVLARGSIGSANYASIDYATIDSPPFAATAAPIYGDDAYDGVRTTSDDAYEEMDGPAPTLSTASAAVSDQTRGGGPPRRQGYFLATATAVNGVDTSATSAAPTRNMHALSDDSYEWPDQQPSNMVNTAMPAIDPWYGNASDEPIPRQSSITRRDPGETVAAHGGGVVILQPPPRGRQATSAGGATKDENMYEKYEPGRTRLYDDGAFPGAAAHAFRDQQSNPSRKSRKIAVVKSRRGNSGARVVGSPTPLNTAMQGRFFDDAINDGPPGRQISDV